MKTKIRSLVVGLCLISVTPVFALANAILVDPMAPSTQPQPSPVIVTHRTNLSGAELAKYQQHEQAAKPTDKKQAAGEGMDKSTIAIIAVVAVIVVVAVAAGGGGGGGSGY